MNENENLQPVEKLTPFTKMVMSIGTLPSSFYASMSYYESMVWLYEYLKNQVIPTVNNNAEAVEELQAKYLEFSSGITEEVTDFKSYINGKVDELETYMNNYFTNLDVQTEINNKLDAMATDGTLTNLIKNYVDPIYQAYETSINSSISIIDAKVDAATSGSPAGVYATVSALTSADPDHSKIYVVTEDGKWYYYNNGWVAGGTYQATSIGTNAIAPDNLNDDLKNILAITIPTITVAETGKYVNKRGVIDTTLSQSFCYTNPIELKKNYTIKYNAKGFSTDVSLISTCDENGDNIKARVVSTDNTYKEYSYTATEDTYVILSYDNSTPAANFVISNNIDDINDRLEDVESEFNVTIPAYTLTSGYIDNNGHIQTANNFKISSPIYVTAGSTIYLYARGYLQVISMITEVTEDGTILQPLVVSTDSNYNVYTYEVTTDKYIEICYLSDNENDLRDFYIKYEFNNISSILNELNISNNSNFNVLSMFNNITCIGDSLTYSQVYTAASTSRQAYETYPEVLTKITGTPTTNLALGGLTPTTWWNEYNDDIVEKTNQISIIFLGTNGELTDTVETDCAGSDYTQYANTNTGNFGKIIKKSQDVGSKVILVKCYENMDTFNSNNAVIEKLATKFNVPVIHNNRFEEAIYHYYPDLSGTNTIHYNDLGYNKFANYINTNINNLNTEKLKTILPV